MSTSDVKPTRMELIETKRKIKLSKSGYKLLKMKRDGLIMEFFELLPKVKDLRSQLSELYSDAMEKLAIAVAADGKTALESAANCLNKAPKVELSSTNISVTYLVSFIGMFRSLAFLSNVFNIVLPVQSAV